MAREREGMRKKEGRERKEREKMREDREIAGLKRFESIKKKKNYFIQLQYHLTFEMYCSYMSKKFWPFPIWPPRCWDFLGLYAKCILHLAYVRPAGDALKHWYWCRHFAKMLNLPSKYSNNGLYQWDS